MAKNLIPQIAQMLGVELGEEFKVKGDDETTYIFTDDGLKLTYDGGIGIVEISSDVAFAALVKGTDEIVKLPWKPKKGDVYLSFWAVSGLFARFGGAVFRMSMLYLTKAGFTARAKKRKLPCLKWLLN